MGCLRVTATRVASNVSVEVSRISDMVCLTITRIASKVSVEVSRLTSAPSISLTKIGGVTISTSLVCTTSSASGIEMWWCAGWRVLWNNGVKTLWKN